MNKTATDLYNSYYQTGAQLALREAGLIKVSRIRPENDPELLNTNMVDKISMVTAPDYVRRDTGDDRYRVYGPPFINSLFETPSSYVEEYPSYGAPAPAPAPAKPVVRQRRASQQTPRAQYIPNDNLVMRGRGDYLNRQEGPEAFMEFYDYVSERERSKPPSIIRPRKPAARPAARPAPARPTARPAARPAPARPAPAKPAARPAARPAPAKPAARPSGGLKPPSKGLYPNLTGQTYYPSFL